MCNNRKGHAYGYIWRYADEYDFISQEELKLEHVSARAKAIYKCDLNGVILEGYESAASASRTFSNIYEEQRKIARNINAVCCGTRKQEQGYKWKFSNNGGDN